MILSEKEKILSMTPHFGKTESNLFSREEFEILLNFRPISGQKRFIPCSEGFTFKWWPTVWQTDPSAWPNNYIREVINETSIYFRDCSKINKKINNFSLMLENLFNKPVDCHIYYSHKLQNKTFGKHNDEQHNVIVCAEGKQNCEVFGDQTISKVMSPGDYVFIPKHIDHRITPMEEKRISLSFCVSADENLNFEDRGWINV